MMQGERRRILRRLVHWCLMLLSGPIDVILAAIASARSISNEDDSDGHEDLNDAVIVMLKL